MRKLTEQTDSTIIDRRAKISFVLALIPYLSVLAFYIAITSLHTDNLFVAVAYSLPLFALLVIAAVADILSIILGITVLTIRKNTLAITGMIIAWIPIVLSIGFMMYANMIQNEFGSFLTGDAKKMLSYMNDKYDKEFSLIGSTDEYWTIYENSRPYQGSGSSQDPIIEVTILTKENTQYLDDYFGHVIKDEVADEIKAAIKAYYPDSFVVFSSKGRVVYGREYDKTKTYQDLKKDLSIDDYGCLRIAVADTFARQDDAVIDAVKNSGFKGVLFLHYLPGEAFNSLKEDDFDKVLFHKDNSADVVYERM